MFLTQLWLHSIVAKLKRTLNLNIKNKGFEKSKFESRVAYRKGKGVEQRKTTKCDR